MLAAGWIVVVKYFDRIQFSSKQCVFVVYECVCVYEIYDNIGNDPLDLIRLK